jgi:hypothetical protein
MEPFPNRAGKRLLFVPSPTFPHEKESDQPLASAVLGSCFLPPDYFCSARFLGGEWALSFSSVSFPVTSSP